MRLRRVFHGLKDTFHDHSSLRITLTLRALHGIGIGKAFIGYHIGIRANRLHDIQLMRMLSIDPSLFIPIDLSEETAALYL